MKIVQLKSGAISYLVALLILISISINFLSLNFAMIDKGYKHNQWLTFKQLKTLGGDIKNNSWNYIYKFGRINVVDENKKPVVDSKGKQKSRNYFRCFVVARVSFFSQTANRW